MNCNVEQHRTYRQISRLSSNESAECPGSIFDYQGAHPSVDLDDLCSDSIELDEITSDCVTVEANAGGNSIAGTVRNTVLFESFKVTANNAVHVNCQPVAPSKSKLPHSSSVLPTSSRMQSRLPAPHSRAVTKAASGNHYGSKSDQLVSGLTLTNAAVFSASLNAGSKVGSSRFH